VENIYQGVATLLISAVLFVLAFRSHADGQYSKALWLLVLGGLLVRVYCSADMFLHTWDERYHALVAKNFLKHWLKPTLYDDPVLGYNNSNWGYSHIWLHKQPLPIWLIAASLKVFGIHDFAVRVPSVIMTTLGIKLMYDIALYYYDRTVAFFAAFLFSVNGLIVELTSGRWATDHIDAAFLFFTLLSVHCIVNYLKTDKAIYNLLAGLSLGCAIFSKWLPALIIAPVWLLLVYDKRRALNAKYILQFAVFLIVAAIVVLPWHIYINKTYPAEAALAYAHMRLHITTALDGQSGNILYHFDKMRMMYGELVYLAVLWFTLYSISNLTDIRALSLTVWLWGVYIFFSLVATKMRGYTIIATPALFMITAHASVWFRNYALKFAGSGYRFLLVLISWCFVLLPVLYGIERMKPFKNNDRQTHWAKKLKEIGRSDLNSGKTVLVNCSYPLEAMFYTDCIAYEQLPGQATIDALKQQGYNVVVMERL
jgi:4-amino-4-deoxy-L-arabinose transferase-like glycosyltransferase